MDANLILACLSKRAAYKKVKQRFLNPVIAKDTIVVLKIHILSPQ